MRLVAALAGCSIEDASRIVGRPYAGVASESLASKVAAILRPSPSGPWREIALPSDFRRLDDSPMAAKFVDYLTRPIEQRGRGFTRAQVMRMTDDYGIYYALFGEQRYRVVFTVRHEGRLVGWTGRTIAKGEELRYKASDGDDMPRVTDFVMWLDRLRKTDADTIILVEGPFDALKVNVLGEECGIVSTCFFTAQPSDEQIGLFCDILPRFQRRMILTDRGTTATAMRIYAALSHLAEVATLQGNIKDPGDFSRKNFLQFTQRYSLTNRT